MNKSLKALAATAALTLSLSGPSFAAVDMYLQLKDGNTEIQGDSLDNTYKGQIDILAWSWGVSNSGTTHMGVGSGAGKPNFQDISITKYIDSASSELYTNAGTGKILTEGTLTIVKPSVGGSKPFVTFTFKMENILVSSISTGGSGGEDRLTENVSLNFSKFTVTNITQKNDGSAGTKEEFCFDIEAHNDC